MLHQFTAAAQRVLIHASAWTNRTSCDELDAQSLLVGLLAEPETRAAAILANFAVDVTAVRQHWPNLAEIPPLPRGTSPQIPFSRDVELSLELARQRLAALPQPLELATEHILLGLVAADHEVAQWLRQRGLDPDALAAQIHAMFSGQPQTPETSTSDTCAERTIACRPTAALRALDAAANRTREALRVVEDYVRFALDDRHLTQLCKQMRHDLTDALGQIALDDRLAARETQADVGTTLTTAAEQSRVDAAEVLAANFARLQESLRSLEEFGKLIDANLAAVFKQLRYRSYTMHRAVNITRQSIERLATAKLYVLIDGRASIAEFEQLARGLIDAGVDVLQLRDKQLADRDLLHRARLLRRLTDGTGTLMIVNDRPDVAALAHADGVHLGQDELSVKDARSIVGPEPLVGVSTHSIEQARQAVLDGANYIGVGPTFPSGTKQFTHFPGVKLLRTVAAEIRLPAFAIGGIGPHNLAEVLSTGFTRVAVSGAVTAADDPARAAKQLLNLLGPTEQ